jgi:hypothetical protein
MARHWFAAFLLTLAIETPLVVFLLRAHEERLGRRLLIAAFASLATHPLVWFVFPALPLAPWPRFWASEIWAVATEAAFFSVAVRGLPVARAAATSLAANAASALSGLALAGSRWGAWLG